jgi:hypothetical protein
VDPECLRAHIAGALDAAPDESFADAGAAHPGVHRERAEPGPAGREVAPSLEPNVGVERDRSDDSPPALRDEDLRFLESRTHVHELP